MTQRIAQLRERFFAGEYRVHRVEALFLSILDAETEKLPFCIRKALAFEKALSVMPIFLEPGELIVGGKTLYRLPEHITDDEKAHGNPNFETKGYNNAFDNCFNLGQDDRGYGIVDSSIPAYYKVVPMGLPALIAQAESAFTAATTEEAQAYYRSVVIANRAAVALIARYEALVREAARDEADKERRAELRQMTENLHALQNGAPATYWQAVQLMYFIQFLIWTEGGYLIPLGRTDQILYPFYKKDTEASQLAPEFALEIMESFFVKLNYEIDRTHGEAGKFESDTGQSITIGGVHPDTGADATNDLTYMILDAKCDLRLTDPKVHLRIHRDTPQAIWEKAAYLNSLGMGFPTYENDEIIIPAFMSHDDYYSLEDARDYAASGCWEMTIQGRSFNRNLGMIDCLRCLEWALNDGRYVLGTPGADTAVGLIGDRYGLPTGEAERLDTWQKLWNAFKVQMKHNIDMVTSYCNRSMASPSPFYSSMMEDCMKKGMDFDTGGCRYNETDFQLSSLTDAADAFYSIKRLVYDEKRLSLRELVDILNANWEGHEALRQEILNEFPKFGNDVDEVDRIAADILKYYTREVKKHRNSFDGPYRARISSALGYIILSQILGASADGRRARDVYTDNLSPRAGADKNGPTAVIRSCSKLDFSECAGGAVLDLKFHPSALRTGEGREKFAALLKSFFQLGGMQVQINVLDNSVLLDAKSHPEKYRDLIVRVWGFSTYFVSLPEKYQDHIIQRSVMGL